MRILNAVVERVGFTQDGRMIARGRDMAKGWTFAFIVPVRERDRILAGVREGKHPVLQVPQVETIPWGSLGPVTWE